MRFFSSIRRSIIDEMAPTTIDLSELQFIMPSSAALLIAEIDRAQRICKGDFKVHLIRSKTERINSVLDQIGFSALCGSKLGKDEVDQAQDELVRHWRYATGTRVNDQTERAFTDIQGRLAPALQDGMWVGISEAVGNAALHAYLEPRGTNRRRMGTKRWWMLSQVRDGLLGVTVADLGIGIPRSLPLKWPDTTLRQLFDRLVAKGPDERAIRAAMEVGATRTGKKHRGKGLPQIWKELRDVPGAMIAIYSNKGALNWDGKNKIESSQEFKDSIHGTVISWIVPVDDTKKS